MNLFRLILGNLRQRQLSTWLTALSVALGTAMGVALLVLGREAPKLFGQREFGYSVIIGAKGDALQIVLNNAYLLGSPPGVMDASVYADLTGGDEKLSGMVGQVVPILWGDTHGGLRILGTSPELFNSFPLIRNRPVTIEEGVAFEPAKWQAVLGSEAAKRLSADVGYRFQARHGDEETGHLHDEEWTVVGIMAETGTAYDEAIFVPLATKYAFGEHGEAVLDQQRANMSSEAVERLYEQRQAQLDAIVASGAEDRGAYVMTPDGTVLPRVPEELWRLSGILARTTAPFRTSQLLFAINNNPRATAAIPATQMRLFYDTFIQTPLRLLLAVTVGVTIVAAVSILVGIYNSVQARRKEIAILRSLGATRAKVLLLVTAEALLIGVIGAIVGTVAGHALAALAGGYVAERMGEGISWWTVGSLEAAYVVGVVVLAGLAGLVPAMLAYQTPVSEHLAG
jgi:putative ABC transport system permease protein